MDSAGQDTSQPETDLSAARVGVGLFLVSAAILALQVLQTRILSVQMWHHHSYMVVTMTLLGFGAAGSLVMVLLWIYYLSLVFFVGALFTRAYVRHVH